MRPVRTMLRLLAFVLLIASWVSCAALGGLGEYKEVDCVHDCDGATTTTTPEGGVISKDGDVVIDDSAVPIDGTSPPVDAGVAAIRIRCGVGPGAPPYTDSTGHVWSSDRDFDVGTVITNNDVIAGTSDPTLYHAERYAGRTTNPSGFKYTFTGIANGNGVVRLHFVEATSAPIVGAGQRRFNVLVNGVVVLTDLDIFAEAGGRDRALVKELPVTISGSALILQFAPGSVENPKVNAIEVLPKL